jgi:hypothetical protein
MRDRLDCAVTEIGEIVPGQTLAIVDPDGGRWVPRRFGHDHFG